MGRDYEFVAYRGAVRPDHDIDRLMANALPSWELCRHATGPAAWADRPGAELADLHCLALYADVRGDMTGLRDNPDARTPRAAETLYFPEDHIREMQRLAARQDTPLRDIVEGAWKLMREQFAHVEPRSTPAPNDRVSPMLDLARMLSTNGGDAFWLSRGDHACIGGYARFRNGELVAPRAIADLYVEGDDSIGGPERDWSAALGSTVTLADVVARYFPDAVMPGLRVAGDPVTVIPFDGDRYDLAFADVL